MTIRAEKITEYYRRLELLNPESKKYEYIYNEFKTFLRTR